MEIHRYGLCIIYTWGGGEGGREGGGKGIKPYDCPYQLAVKRGEQGLTDKPCPGFPICTYNMYNTSTCGFSFAYLPFCWKTSLDTKWIQLIRIIINLSKPSQVLTASCLLITVSSPINVAYDHTCILYTRLVSREVVGRLRLDGY